MKHFNGLTPAEAERLALLIEECGEAIQAAGKILRHGYESLDPTADPHNSPSNRQRLLRELGDVRAIVAVMAGEGDIDHEHLVAAAKDKLRRMAPYLHHQTLGTFSD